MKTILLRLKQNRKSYKKMKTELCPFGVMMRSYLEERKMNKQEKKHLLKNLQYFNQEIKIITYGNSITIGKCLDYNKKEIIIEKKISENPIILKEWHFPRFVVKSIEIMKKTQQKPKDAQKIGFLEQYKSQKSK